MLTRKLTKEEWISINTDGPENPLSKVYTKKDVYKLFSSPGFKTIRTLVRFFDKTHYGLVGKLLPNFFCDFVGNAWGWNRWVEAVKPEVGC